MGNNLHLEKEEAVLTSIRQVLKVHFIQVFLTQNLSVKATLSWGFSKGFSPRKILNALKLKIAPVQFSR